LLRPRFSVAGEPGEAEAGEKPRSIISQVEGSGIGLKGIVTLTVFTAHYLLLTKRIERIQWVNKLTKAGVGAFAGEM
jgi:hypothetical protein